MHRLLLILALTLLPAAGVLAEEAAADAVVQSDVNSRYVDPSDMSQVPRLVSKVLVRATAKAKRGEHAEAIAVLNEHLTAHPDQDHYLVRYHLARSHDALEQYGDARRQYAAAVALEPRLSAGWFGLGHVNYTLGNFEESAAAFHESFRTDANPQPETLYFAAAGYMAAEDYAAAAPMLAELCGGGWGTTRHDWYAQLASCAIHLEQRDLAAPVLAAYLANDPGSHEAWYLSYQFHVGFKEYRDAAVALTMVGYLRDLTSREQRTLGDLYNVVGVPALASDQYHAVLNDDARSEDYERLASALVASHDLEGALSSLRQGLQTHPTLRLWSLLGDVHYLRKDYAAAAEAFTQVIQLDHENGRAWLMIGYCQIELGNRGLAIQNLVAAAKYEDQSDLAERLLQRARKMNQSPSPADAG